MGTTENTCGKAKLALTVLMDGRRINYLKILRKAISQVCEPWALKVRISALN